MISMYLNLNKKFRANRVRVSENFTILKKCQSRLECLIFEMLYIRKKRLKLNTQADSIRAKLFV